MASAIVGNFTEVILAFGVTAGRIEGAGKLAEEQGADMVAQRAAAKAPRLTGHMATSITDDGATVIVDTPYAGYQEYGTRHHGAQPFLRPAAAEAEPFLSKVAEVLVTIATR